MTLGKILVATATLNESNNISELLSELSLTYPALDILIVDGGSSDNTISQVVAEQVKNQNINYIVQEKRLGIASAHLLAYKYAITNKYDYLITMDADLSHDPKEITNFLEKHDNQFDLIVGSRYCNGGATDNSGYRYWISKGANVLAARIIGGKLSEYTTSFRMFRVESLSQIDTGLIDSKGYSFFFRVINAFVKSGFSVGEVPIHFNERKHGKSKIPKFEIIRSLVQLIRIPFTNPRINSQLIHSYQNCKACRSNFIIGVNRNSSHVRDQDESKFGIVPHSNITYCCKCGNLKN